MTPLSKRMEGDTHSVYGSGGTEPWVPPHQGGYPKQAERCRQDSGTGARVRARAGPAGPAHGYPDIQPINTDFTSKPRREKLTAGFLEDSHPNCGSVRYKVLCPEIPKHFVREHKYSCHRPGCPQCWKSWAGRAARAAGDKVDGFEYPLKARHVVFSPSPDSIPYEDEQRALAWMIDEGRKLCQNMGLKAVAAIAHPYRIIPQFQSIADGMATAAGVNRYVWALGRDNWQDLVYFSPHLHLMAYGPLPKSDDVEKKTGWTYVNYDEDGEGRTGDELKQTIFYLLTHAWVRDNPAPVRYWFGLSSRQLGCTQTTEREPVFCPDCGTQTVSTPPDVVRDDGTVYHQYQDLRMAPKYFRKVIRRRYWKKQLKWRLRHENTKKSSRSSKNSRLLGCETLPG